MMKNLEGIKEYDTLHYLTWKKWRTSLIKRK